MNHLESKFAGKKKVFQVEKHPIEEERQRVAMCLSDQWKDRWEGTRDGRRRGEVMPYPLSFGSLLVSTLSPSHVLSLNCCCPLFASERGAGGSCGNIKWKGSKQESFGSFVSLWCVCRNLWLIEREKGRKNDWRRKIRREWIIHFLLICRGQYSGRDEKGTDEYINKPYSSTNSISVVSFQSCVSGSFGNGGGERSSWIWTQKGVIVSCFSKKAEKVEVLKFGRAAFIRNDPSVRTTEIRLFTRWRIVNWLICALAERRGGKTGIGYGAT